MHVTRNGISEELACTLLLCQVLLSAGTNIFTVLCRRPLFGGFSRSLVSQVFLFFELENMAMVNFFMRLLVGLLMTSTITLVMTSTFVIGLSR